MVNRHSLRNKGASTVAENAYVHVRVCVCVCTNAEHFHYLHLGSALQFCTTSAGHIAGKCLSVSRRWYQGLYVLYCDVMKIWTKVERSLLLAKSIERPPGLTPPFCGEIDINSTYVFTTNELRRDFAFNPRIFGAKTRDWGSAPPSLLIPIPGKHLKQLSWRGLNPV